MKKYKTDAEKKKRAAYMRRWRKDNPKHTEYQKKYHEKWHAEKGKNLVIEGFKKPLLSNDEMDRLEYNKSRRKRWNKLSVEYKMWRACRNRAKERDLEFNLSIEDVIVPDICPYLNHKITRIAGSGRINTNPSIDRIDPTKGYTKENIQIISIQANIMKSNSSIKELVLFAKNVLLLHAEQLNDDSKNHH